MIAAIQRHCTCDHDGDAEQEEDWFQKHCSVCNPESALHDVSMDEIRNKQFRLKYLPVVDSHENMNLLFMIELEQLRKKCNYYFGSIENLNASQIINEQIELRLMKINSSPQEEMHSPAKRLIE